MLVSCSKYLKGCNTKFSSRYPTGLGVWKKRSESAELLPGKLPTSSVFDFYAFIHLVCIINFQKNCESKKQKVGANRELLPEGNHTQADRKTNNDK